MKKLSTFFKKDPNDLGRVINEVNPENEWVLTHGIPTRKFDGTSCAIIDGELYKRYDAKINKKTGKRRSIPEGAIPCQEADPHGSWPHWVKCDRNDNSDRYHFEAFDKEAAWIDGTYELVGPRINGNKEKFDSHVLIEHGVEFEDLDDFSFDAIREYLLDHENDIEGIVFHHRDENDNRMCKIRKSDFGIKR